MLFKKTAAFYVFILLAFSSLFFSCTKKKTNTITVATAANMQYAMKELTNTFTQLTSIKCNIIISSSGKLTAQIKEGAPYDIFVSADMKFPNELNKHGFSATTPKIYAYGKLILWSTKNNIQPSFDLLTSEKIKHIAIANPKTAPYGIAAEEILKKEQLFEHVKHKFVYGESVAQTNQFITTNAAEIGFTAKSVIYSSNIKNKGNWIDINQDNYTSISQGVVILKNSPSNQNQVKQFYNFLFSKKGIEILNKFGYSTK
ncbi:molybdate transport system substrate-binding protein [Lutibacter oricola]|uniref:Molybdate transport system substrate-binding protein n=1 Tax=Lutibacter oricola TaxID=762486 RepID=A0A1H3BII7_9FLAO|nr:molybdate ABC transporter substrate-binding protein [Lutibacter oricola]SDX41531.1 molybdate transport system substrate-binding protein [Lutibacter oricola]